MTVYCVVNVEDITNEMIDEAVNEGQYLRYSLDQSKAILKFNSFFPTSMKGYIKYNQDEILELLSEVEWNDEES